MDNNKKVRALLKIPGNLACADCGDSGKAVVKFCSVKLGVFLCNQCYAAHRALGAHITRGKCIGLDEFNDPEVERLNRLGNARVNAQYEATMPANGVKPPPTPCNGCSLSTCRDCKERLRFITDKYEKRLWYAQSPVLSSTLPATISANDTKASAPAAPTNSDPFGLFHASSTNPPPARSQAAKPPIPASSVSDTDFFASFGL